MAVIRALASHQCGPGSNFGGDAKSGLSLLLGLVPTPKVFFRVLWFPPQKPTFLNYLKKLEVRATLWHCRTTNAVQQCYNV